MPKRTPLYAAHIAAGARMVDFGGWEMPINYGSQMKEHDEVRQAAGMFDVSHMTVVDINGPQARHFLSYLLANDVAKLTEPGRAFYTCMLNQQGGVVDDLITYFLDEDFFRIVVNAATHDKDMAWIDSQARAFDVVANERPELAMIAVQGPKARESVLTLLPESDARAVAELRPFRAGQFGELFIARTGYTGEDGFEISMPAESAVAFWEQLSAAGVAPCGLGARDTLRLEAGMNLYGQDMDENVTPFEAGLAWTVALKDDRAFIGKEALLDQKARGVDNKLVGLVLRGRGVLRPGQRVVTDAGEGMITSGSFSPTLQQAIAFARVPQAAGGTCQVDIRGKLLDCNIVRPPFVRNGTVCEGIV
ncbi:MAG: glycine cleavage system aminomethyltransferase GcvT [Xanthomonadales bacterium]|nr:glycine cleavage system aminomethyltransferase GcvT [Gammaproteobacteria bacterium]NNK04189.1 glycine cleavage system aminomethyltransferase GcvT [Xanthomonadales bacterium]